MNKDRATGVEALEMNEPQIGGRPGRVVKPANKNNRCAISTATDNRTGAGHVSAEDVSKPRTMLTTVERGATFKNFPNPLCS